MAYHKGPDPTSRLAEERHCVDLKGVQDIVDEFDGGLTESSAWNWIGVAQPSPGPIHCDDVNPPQMFQERDEGER
jgi:hypothetical protein